MTLLENQSLGVVRTTAPLQGPHSPASTRTASAPAFWGRARRALVTSSRARPPARSFSGLEWCRRFRFHRCRERRFPAGRPRRCLPSVQSAASSPALLSLSLLAGSRPGRSHAERASPQGHVQAEQRLAASAGS